MKKNSLEDRTYDQFKHLLGERCEVLDEKGEKHVGILQFAGKNQTFGFEQVTLSRCPIRNVQMNTLKKYKRR